MDSQELADAVRRALLEYPGGGQEGITARELGESLKWSVERVRVGIRVLLQKDLAEFAGGRPSTTIDGRRSWEPIYRLKERESVSTETLSGIDTDE